MINWRFWRQQKPQESPQEYKLPSVEPLAKEEVKPYFLANRHYIHTINPNDFNETFEGMSDAEQRDYVAQASLVWANDVFQKEIKRMVAAQAIFVAANCESWEKSLIGRGGINGIGLVEERFKDLHSMHLESIQRVDEEDDGVIPSV